MREIIGFYSSRQGDKQIVVMRNGKAYSRLLGDPMPGYGNRIHGPWRYHGAFPPGDLPEVIAWNRARLRPTRFNPLPLPE